MQCDLKLNHHAELAEFAEYSCDAEKNFTQCHRVILVEVSEQTLGLERMAKLDNTCNRYDGGWCVIQDPPKDHFTQQSCDAHNECRAVGCVTKEAVENDKTIQRRLCCCKEDRTKDRLAQGDCNSYCFLHTGLGPYVSCVEAGKPEEERLWPMYIGIGVNVTLLIVVIVLAIVRGTRRRRRRPRKTRLVPARPQGQAFQIQQPDEIPLPSLYAAPIRHFKARRARSRARSLMQSTGGTSKAPPAQSNATPNAPPAKSDPMYDNLASDAFKH